MSRALVQAITLYLQPLEASQAQLNLATEIARRLHDELRFEIVGDAPRDRLDDYRMPNGAYDLDRFLVEQESELDVRRPLMLITGLPYGDSDHADDPDETYFADYSIDEGGVRRPELSVMSSYLWHQVLPDFSFQNQLLMTFATWLLADRAGLSCHEETRGCLFDYCVDPSDARQVIERGNPLCDACMIDADRAIRRGMVSIATVAAAKRLYYRSLDRRVCFFAMPFTTDFDAVFAAGRHALTTEDWIVTRADLTTVPRQISQRILLEILSASSVVVDITDENPNVFLELGYSIGLEQDIVLISQGEEIPFNIHGHQRIHYDKSPGGLLSLGAHLHEALGPGHW
jgi:hypothetical protein